MSENSNRNSGINAAATSHVHHATLEDIAQFTPEKTGHIWKGGIRKEAIPIRTDAKAQQMVEKIPASHRAGIDGKSAAAKVKEYLHDKDASHIIARSKGGSSDPSNLKWEDHTPNLKRGGKTMTPKEQRALDAKVTSDNLSGAFKMGIDAGVKGAVIGAVTALPFSFLRNALRVSRGEITNEEAALAILKDTGIGGAVGGVTAISVTTVAAAFPPVAALLATASPALLVVGGAGMVYEFFKILEDHKQEVRNYYNSLTEQQLSYLQKVDDEINYEHDKNLRHLDEQRAFSEEISNYPRGNGIQGALDRLQQARINAERAGLSISNTKLLSSFD